MQERVKELRSAGDPVALLAAAKAAADEIEHRVGERWDDAQRQSLIAVKRMTFNAAADCWPGWSVPTGYNTAPWSGALRHSPATE